MINKEFINNLSPVEVEFLSGYISSLVHEKVKNDTDNHENLNVIVHSCPKCGSTHFVKNGFNPKKRQKYRCKDCNSVFLSTTGTLFQRSKLSYNEWTSFIAGEINGLTLLQQSVNISRTLSTCFYMRHKLYKAIETFVYDQMLHDEIKLDFTYFNINLKGTKPKNMPRISKKRGKSDKHDSLRGLNGHKICVLTAIDSSDDHIAAIAGLGAENIEKLSSFDHFFKKGSKIILDSKPGFNKYLKEKGHICETVPRGKHISRKGDHINDINQFHQELKELNRKYRGISTRHLQDYLNFHCFFKKLCYSTEPRRRKIQTYLDVMKTKRMLFNKDICTINMPISLYKAYGAYHYGIFANVS